MIDYPMEQTMRWFGPADPVSLADIRQAGCTGVVSALHHIPNGAVWPVEQIAARKAEIEAADMRWSVVESLPVHEAIKRGTNARDSAIAAYKASLANLAACDIRTVTYNFMPLLDWTRTDLAYAMPDGARALRFEAVALAAYDIHMLRRPYAAADYPIAVQARAAERFVAMEAGARLRLERAIIAGLPGSEESFGSADFLAAIQGYAGINADCLRAHLIGFLAEICPVADALGIRLVIHPDDPPFALFGLPRVVSNESDLAALFDAVPANANGLCLCTGSLGVRPDNDLVAMIRRFGARIHFLHLRNTRRDTDGNFYESAHLEGDADMAAIVRAVRDLSRAERRSIPMRPDHGHQMLNDLSGTTNPGYSAIGRLRGLAELRGLERGLAHEENEA